MLNSNEVCQASMDIDTLTLFNYITQGASNDIDIDHILIDEIELNFDWCFGIVNAICKDYANFLVNLTLAYFMQ